MQVSTRKKRRVCIVDVTGRLTLAEGEEQLRERLSGLLKAGERRFVFNLNGLSVIDSAGVGEIVACYQKAAESAAVIKIALKADGLVRHVFKFTGLENALEVFDEEKDAIASF